jgi:hypothetical protein
LTGRNLQAEKMDEWLAAPTDPAPRRETALNLEYKRQKDGAYHIKYEEILKVVTPVETGVQKILNI